MPKGFYSQCFCLLTDGQTTIDDVKQVVLGHRVKIVKESAGGEEWFFGGPTITIPFRPEVNGYVAIDVVGRTWPDTMGDSKSEPMVFGAWAMGHFGPFAYPGGLKRAGEQARAWAAGKDTCKQHRGFIRIRTSYIFGADKNLQVLPEDYEPIPELNTLSRLVKALFSVPGVLCYFNPNGEVLLDSTTFSGTWNPCEEQGYLPLALWVNVRLFNLTESLTMMDTVGNAQLDISDVEAVFPKSKYKPHDVGYYLRNLTMYLLGLKRQLRSGESIDGPGESNLQWEIEVCDNGLADPPRRIVRISPKASRHEIHAAIESRS